MSLLGKPFWKDQVFWLVVAQGFVFGAVFNFAPVTFPVFRRAFHANPEQLGRIQLVWFMGALGFGLVGGWFVRRLGARKAAATILLLLAAGLTLIGSARVLAQVLVGAAACGLALAAIVVVNYTLICERFPQRQQSIFFISSLTDAAGAMIGPAALGAWLSHSERSGVNWGLGYFGAAALVCALAVRVLLLRGAQIPDEHADAPARPPALHDLRRVAATWPLYVIGLAMFLHGVAQVGMTSWVGQLYQKRLAITTAQAAWFLSINSAGFVIGRVLLSWITARRRIPQLAVLAFSAALGSAAFFATVASPSYPMGLVMFALAGVFISGNGPSLNSLAGVYFAGRAATAFAVLGAISNLGCAGGPYLVGVIGKRFGLAAGMWMIPLFSLALALLALVWHMTQRRGRQLEA